MPDIGAQIVAKCGAELHIVAAVLRWWTARRDYLEALARGEPRVDLAGRPMGSPTPKERELTLRALAALGGGR